MVWHKALQYTIEVLLLISALIIYDYSEHFVSWIAAAQFFLLLIMQAAHQRHIAFLQSKQAVHGS
jgi:hypothetical protein